MLACSTTVQQYMLTREMVQRLGKVGHFHVFVLCAVWAFTENKSDVGVNPLVK